MDTLVPVGLVLIGLALLAGGGEALVRAATTIAHVAGVSPAVIGLTVVAMGTSLPELVVSMLSALRGEPDLAVANVVGSNIFNIAATLGITAMILPLPVHGSAVRLEWPVMFVASLICVVVTRGGLIDRVEGGVLLVALVLFVAYTVRVARRDVGVAEARQFAEQVEARDIDPADRADSAAPPLALTLAVLAVGIAALVGGGRLLVDGAVSLARVAGVSERVIGLTIVAGGTGAPELATSLVAALRGRTDVAIANMIGSNIFNILGILGLTALIWPLPVAPALVRSDMWWMVGTSLLLLPLMRSGARLARGEGVLLLGAYVAYLIALLNQ
jgi:cation:H+ antiporter